MIGLHTIADHVGPAIGWESATTSASAWPATADQPSSVTARGAIEALSHTVHANGVYYAVAYNDTAFAHSCPYSLTAFGSPNVTWPHPCVVPKLRRHSDLGTAKRRLTLSSCSVGRVKRVPSRAPRGEVVRLAPGAGTIAAPGARVAIVVSRGSR